MWNGYDSPKIGLPETEEIHGIVKGKSENTDNLILVTHMEVSSDYPAHFLYKEYHKFFGKKGLGRGKAYMIDLNERKMLELPTEETIFEF